MVIFYVLAFFFSSPAFSGPSELIKRTYRPPNYETPLESFHQIITPNDQFFIRYHLANIPKVELETWKLSVEGEALEKPFTLNFESLKNDFPTVEIIALLFCSGNQRGFMQPQVPGIQWQHGAMGNAKWKGVRLRDVLMRAGLKKTAVEIEFHGADGPVIPATPDFVKSIPAEKALDKNTLIVYEMNGQRLPQHNGFPVRLIVPGWTATYWMKHLTSIKALSKPSTSYWMTQAYRIPKGTFSVETAWKTQESTSTVPITEIIVNSVITNVKEGQQFKLSSDSQASIEIKGLAWDGGHGIQKVEISTDGGKKWALAKLGNDFGRFSWREFTFQFSPQPNSKVKPTLPGNYVISSRATNSLGQTQPEQAIPNPGGYHHNAFQKLHIKIHE